MDEKSCVLCVGCGVVGGGVLGGMRLLLPQTLPCAVHITIHVYLKKEVNTVCRGCYHMPLACEADGVINSPLLLLRVEPLIGGRGVD